MKIRFDQQSLRLRVRKSDLTKLQASGLIEEVVFFPENKFSYTLGLKDVEKDISVTINEQNIAVYIPSEMAEKWINSEEVGLYVSIPTEHAGISLHIIIEKDFPCKHGSSEENADTFGELSGD
jgi:hypothetical protein